MSSAAWSRRSALRSLHWAITSVRKSAIVSIVGVYVRTGNMIPIGSEVK